MYKYLIGLNEDETYFCCFIPLDYNISMDRIRQLFSSKNIVEMGMCYPKQHGFINFIAGINIKPSSKSLGNDILNRILDKGEIKQIAISNVLSFICGYKRPNYFSVTKKDTIPYFSVFVNNIENKKSLVNLLIDLHNQSYGGEHEQV